MNKKKFLSTLGIAVSTLIGSTTFVGTGITKADIISNLNKVQESTVSRSYEQPKELILYSPNSEFQTTAHQSHVSHGSHGSHGSHSSHSSSSF